MARISVIFKTAPAPRLRVIFRTKRPRLRVIFRTGQRPRTRVVFKTRPSRLRVIFKTGRAPRLQVIFRTKRDRLRVLFRTLRVWPEPYQWSYAKACNVSAGTLTLHGVQEGEILTATILKWGEHVPLTTEYQTSGDKASWYFMVGQDTVLSFRVVSNFRGVVSEGFLLHDWAIELRVTHQGADDTIAWLNRRQPGREYLYLKAIHLGIISSYEVFRFDETVRLFKFTREFGKLQLPPNGPI